MKLRYLFISSLLLAHLSVSASAQTKAVYGYKAAAQQLSLTQNGNDSLLFKQVPKALIPALSADLATLSRKLNLLSLQKFDPQRLQPVLAAGKLQIRYRDQVLLTPNPAWARYYKLSELSTTLLLNNSLRRHFGAAPLRSYTFLSDSAADQVGLASWYGGFFHGRLTANGERYDVNQLTAAHKKLPFGTRVLVTNVATKKSVVVKINDRGPFKAQRIIDLSPAAFEQIGNRGSGIMQVKLTVLS